MGACFSKKTTNSSKSAPLHNPPKEIKSNVQLEKNKVEEETGKKEILIIKHRKSHDTERRSNNEDIVDAIKVTEIAESCKPVDCNNASDGSEILVAAPVRTSSCTKEELDAILIQCGRLSRSSSTGKAAGVSASSGSGENDGGSVQRLRRYSGSKRTFDFDNENNGDEIRGGYGRKRDGFEENVERDDDTGVVVREGPNRHRQQQRQSRTVGSPSKGRRRTPSREREQGQKQQSGNRDSSSSSSSGSGGRRVSRSPGRRSESPVTTTSGGANPSTANANSTNGRPGKMVSVPATVSSLAMDKSNNAERTETIISASAIKRTQVKRNAGSEVAAVGSRTSASPRARSRSPAKANVKILNDNQNGSSNQMPQSLSRSNSKKAEISPFRRNPLGEIDNNAPFVHTPVQGLKAPSSILHLAPSQKLNAGHTLSARTSEHGLDNKTCIGKGTVEKNANNASGTECFKPQALTRTRSSRLSRDLDIDPEVLSTPPPSYTSLLLDDIHNFHQTSNPTFTLPACVSKAHSIVEAVEDLNSSTKPNLSTAFADGKKGRPSVEDLNSSTEPNLSTAFADGKKGRPTVELFNKSCDNVGIETLTTGKKGLESKDHFMQSEVVADDDLMKPSFHRYVTVRRGSLGGDVKEQESSGSNSFVGSQQHWVSSSSWEPDSADSTGRTSSRFNSRDDDTCPLGSQRQAISESGYDGEEMLRRLTGKRRESNQQPGIGRGRVGSRGQDRLSVAATAAASM